MVDGANKFEMGTQPQVSKSIHFIRMYLLKSIKGLGNPEESNKENGAKEQNNGD